MSTILMEIIQMINKLLFLKVQPSKKSVLCKKIKNSGKQEKKFQKGASSVLSTKLY